MRNICIALPEELLIEIDEAAKRAWTYRSEYIRRALLKAVAEHEFKAVKEVGDKNPLDPRLLDLDGG